MSNLARLITSRKAPTSKRLRTDCLFNFTPVAIFLVRAIVASRLLDRRP